MLLVLLDDFLSNQTQHLLLLLNIFSSFLHSPGKDSFDHLFYLTRLSFTPAGESSLFLASLSKEGFI